MTKCAADNCERKSCTKIGYCVMHYKRWKRNGAPIRTLREYEPQAKCEHCGGFGSCGRLRKGLCKACSLRKLKKGYVERDIAPKGSGTITAGGYRLMTTRHGREYEHILIARPKLGEIVHHRDHNKLNNHPDNLEVLPSQSAHMKLHSADRRKKHD